MEDGFDLGRQLGRREAFSMVAARCSAAEAAQVREIRDTKSYLTRAQDWDEFCTKYLRMSRDSANRIIHNLEEFGPTYFEVAQLTRISPATYRAIAPAIRDQVLNHDGQAIALIPENAEKVAAAVAELRKPAPAPEPPADWIAVLDRNCADLVVKIEAAVARRKQAQQVRASICYLESRLARIKLTI